MENQKPSRWTVRAIRLKLFLILMLAVGGAGVSYTLYQNIENVNIFLAENRLKRPDYAAMRRSVVKLDVIGGVDEDGSVAPSTGSGFLVDAENCVIMTNNHVVENAAFVMIKGKRAEVVSTFPFADLALVQAASCEGLVQARFADIADLGPGDLVVAVGAPFGLEDSSTEGIISNLERRTSGTGVVPLIQSDTSVNQGNSGGPLFNRAGEVVGVNAVILSQGRGGSLGISLTIPGWMAQEYLDEYRRLGHPSYGKLGVMYASVPGDAMQTLYGESVFAARIVNADGALYPQGSEERLQPGDLVVAVNEVPLLEAHSFAYTVFMHHPDEVLRLRVLRPSVEGSAQHVEVAVLVQEGYTEPERLVAAPYTGALGVKLRSQIVVRNQDRVLLVEGVVNMSPAHEAMLPAPQFRTVRTSVGAGMILENFVAIQGAQLPGEPRVNLTTAEQLEEMAASAAQNGQRMVLYLQRYKINPDPTQPDTLHDPEGLERAVVITPRMFNPDDHPQENE